MNARFLGAYPVVYRVLLLGILSFNCCPIYAPKSCGLLLALDEDKRQEIFEDMLLLTTASINAGIVLRGIELLERPVPGRSIRVDKMWMLWPLFEAANWKASWAAYLTANPRPKGVDPLDDAISCLKSGLPLPGLIRVAQLL